jgi:hypothetical protein
MTSQMFSEVIFMVRCKSMMAFRYLSKYRTLCTAVPLNQFEFYIFGQLLTNTKMYIFLRSAMNESSIFWKKMRIHCNNLNYKPVKQIWYFQDYSRRFWDFCKLISGIKKITWVLLRKRVEPKHLGHQMLSLVCLSIPSSVPEA